jgi:hypothetical protein
MDVTIPCPCPGTPHDGDVVTLRDRLGFLEATAVRKGVMLAGGDGPMATEDRLAKAVEGFVLLGVVAWSLVDEEGKPVPVSKVAIAERLLTHDEAAFEVGEAADDLYAAAVLLPLLNGASKSSRTTPTEPSTSPTTGSSPTPLKRSSRSSTSSTPTDDTATTSSSPGGDSSSSPSSASAA